MLRLFRNNNPFTVLILLIGTLLLKLQALLFPVQPIAPEGHFFYAALLDLLSTSLRMGAFGFTLLAVILLFLQSLYLNYLTVRHKLYTRNTYFPALTYLLITSITPAFNYFSPAVLINWFLLLALDIMFDFVQSPHPGKKIFNAGMVLCLPVLIQFSAVGFILLLPVALLLLRSFRLVEWMAGLSGYITPLYFLAGILLLADRFYLLATFSDFVLPVFSRPAQPMHTVGVVVGLALLLTAGLYGLRQYATRTTIYIRRRWLLILCYFIIAAGVALFAVSPLKTAWLLTLPMLALIITHSYHLENSKRFSIFIFSFSLVLIIFCQLAAYK